MKVSALTKDMIAISGLNPSITDYFNTLDQVFINIDDYFQYAIYDYSQFFEKYEDVLMTVPIRNTHEVCGIISLIGVEIDSIIDDIKDQSFKIESAMKDHYKKTEKIRMNAMALRVRNGSATYKVREDLSNLLRYTSPNQRAKFGVNEIIKLIKKVNAIQKVIPDLMKRFIVPYDSPKTNEKLYEVYFACENAFALQNQLKLHLDMVNAYDMVRQSKIAEGNYAIVQWQIIQMLGTFLSKKNDMLSIINVMIYVINNRSITMLKNLAAANAINSTEQQIIEMAANRYFEVLKHFKVRIPENFTHANFSYSQLFEKYSTNGHFPNAEKIRHFLMGIKQQIYMKWSELNRAKYELELLMIKHNTKSLDTATLFRRLQTADNQNIKSFLIKTIQRNLNSLTVTLGKNYVRVILSVMEDSLQEVYEIQAELPDRIEGFLQEYASIQWFEWEMDDKYEFFSIFIQLLLLIIIIICSKPNYYQYFAQYFSIHYKKRNSNQINNWNRTENVFLLSLISDIIIIIICECIIMQSVRGLLT